MPRTRTFRSAQSSDQEIVQLSLLDHLDGFLAEHEGELVKLPLDPHSIGGSLLEILSNGLYTNPLACIREYVQNSVDAHAANVTIHITGNSVNIFDDGDGMSLAEMLHAREFGLSPKLIEQHVGFRGIGIYSGYDICRKMRITSKKAGEKLQHVLVFDFESMRTTLEADRNRKRQLVSRQSEVTAINPESDIDYERVSLIDLLSEHTYIKREQAIGDPDIHMTHVQLQDISEVHIKQLSNLGELRKYMLQNLPIDFAAFEHKQAINDQLYMHVPGYNAVSIRLQSDGIGEEFVQRVLPNTLQPPTFGYLTNADGRQVAFYWACLNRDQKRLGPGASGNSQSPSLEGEDPTYEGFVYKMKGFTIGDRSKLRSLWGPKETLYRWYTGEIYILDPSVKPNAERDDFETSPSQRALTWAVQRLLKQLYKVVEEYQEQSVADRQITKYAQDLDVIERQVESNVLLPGAEFDLYARLETMLGELKRQRRKASATNHQVADELKKRIERLQRVLQKNEDPRTSETAKRKRAAQSELPIPTDPGFEVEPRPSAPLPEPLLPSTEMKLPDVLQSAGWDLDGKLLILVDLLQASFEDVITTSNPIYRNLLTDIEFRLATDAGN